MQEYLPMFIGTLIVIGIIIVLCDIRNQKIDERHERIQIRYREFKDQGTPGTLFIDNRPHQRFRFTRYAYWVVLKVDRTQPLNIWYCNSAGQWYEVYLILGNDSFHKVSSIIPIPSPRPIEVIHRYPIQIKKVNKAA